MHTEKMDVSKNVKAFNCRDVSLHIAMGDMEQARGFERFKYRFHLAYCWFCRKYERQLRVIAEAFQRKAANVVDKKAIDALQNRIISHLRE